VRGQIDRGTCGNAARTDLCGGRSAMSVPTATRSSHLKLGGITGTVQNLAQLSGPGWISLTSFQWTTVPNAGPGRAAADGIAVTMPTDVNTSAMLAKWSGSGPSTVSIVFTNTTPVATYHTVTLSHAVLSGLQNFFTQSSPGGASRPSTKVTITFTELTFNNIRSAGIPHLIRGIQAG
jgi:hypothetical protein